MFNKKRFFLSFSLLAVIISLTALPLISGASIEDSKQNIYVGSEEVIKGNFIKAGEVIDLTAKLKKMLLLPEGQLILQDLLKEMFWLLAELSELREM